MAIMQGATSIAAGATTNVVQGQQFEILPFDAQVTIGMTESAAGLLTTVFSGTDLLMQSSAVPPTNAAPVYPDNFFLTDVARKGDRIQILSNNPTGGALTLNWVVRIDPI